MVEGVQQGPVLVGTLFTACILQTTSDEKPLRL